MKHLIKRNDINYIDCYDVAFRRLCFYPLYKFKFKMSVLYVTETVQNALIIVIMSVITRMLLSLYIYYISVYYISVIVTRICAKNISFTVY